MSRATRPLLLACDQRLARILPQPPLPPRRQPIGVVVKSLISSRTRDAVSTAAYVDLRGRFGSAAGIAKAPVSAVEQTIAAVTFPDVKAPRLVESLCRIANERGGYTLGHLAELPMPEALADLERLPGVGRKVAASVLNFSTLDRPVLVVDSHIERVLNRVGLKGNATRLSAIVTALIPEWDAHRFRLLHGRLKRLGQTLCSWERPNCARCPLAAICETGSVSSPAMFPA